MLPTATEPGCGPGSFLSPTIPMGTRPHTAQPEAPQHDTTESLLSPPSLADMLGMSAGTSQAGPGPAGTWT